MEGPVTFTHMILDIISVVFVESWCIAITADKA